MGKDDAHYMAFGRRRHHPDRMKLAAPHVVSADDASGWAQDGRCSTLSAGPAPVLTALAGLLACWVTCAASSVFWEGLALSADRAVSFDLLGEARSSTTRARRLDADRRLDLIGGDYSWSGASVRGPGAHGDHRGLRRRRRARVHHLRHSDRHRFPISASFLGSSGCPNPAGDRAVGRPRAGGWTARRARDPRHVDLVAASDVAAARRLPVANAVCLDGDRWLL